MPPLGNRFQVVPSKRVCHRSCLDASISRIPIEWRAYTAAIAEHAGITPTGAVGAPHHSRIILCQRQTTRPTYLFLSISGVYTSLKEC